MLCTPHQILHLCAQIKNKELNAACSTYGGEERCIQVLVGRPKGKRQLGRSGVDGRILLKWIIKKWDGEAWLGLIWFRIGTGCERL